MKQKKSTIAVNLLVVFLLAIFAFVVYSIIFTDLIGKSAAETLDLLSSSKDFDKDGIADYFDKCACAAGEEEFDGCKDEASKEQTKEQLKKCREDIDKAYNPS